MNEKSKVAGHNRLWVSIVFALIAVGLFFNLNSFHGSKNNSQIYAQIDSIYKVEVKPVEQTDYIQSVINHIERNLIFPQDTAKKEDYIGYYSIRETAEKKELVAVFLLKGGWWNYYSKLHMMENIVKPHSNVFFVHLENLPSIEDGGCGVINLSYELTDEPLLESEKIGVMSLTSRKPPEAGVKIIGYCNGHA